MNGSLFQTASFEVSGNWCFENGTPRVKSFEIPLTQGTNSIEIKPTGTDAPFIDKIAILLKPVEVVQGTSEPDVVSSIDLNTRLQKEKVSLSVYPNPSAAQGEFSILVAGPDNDHFDLQVLDILGRPVFRDATGIVNQPLKSGRGLTPGVYLVVVNINSTRYIQKLIVR